MPDRTKVLSVHRLRRNARKREREMQRVIETVPANEGRWRAQWGVPVWARGVRVEKAGPFQHAVVATEHRGH